MERTNRIEHQKVTQNRCFRSDGFCRWSRIFFSLGSRNIVSRNGKVGLRELVGCENPIKTVFWIIAWQLRKCSSPVTIFGIFPSLSMSREMSAENAYTQGFRDLCLDGVLISTEAYATPSSTLQSVRGLGPVELSTWEWSHIWPQM